MNLREMVDKHLLKYKKLKPWHGLIPLVIFLVLALPSGLYLVFNVPAMFAPDGGAHVARVFQISEGGIRPVYINHEKGVGYGGSIPTNVNELKNFELNIVSSDGAPGQESFSKLLTAQDKNAINVISKQKISKQLTLISYVNSAAYSPIAYTPNVIGVVIGKFLNFNLGHTLLLAGLLGFITYILCVGYSLFTLRKSQFKWSVFVVSLLPLTLFQTTVITADSFLMSVGILFSALIVKGFIKDSKLTLLDKLLLFLCVIAIPQVKSVYFPAAFLILLIPRKKWSSKNGYWYWAVPSLLISMGLFIAWSKLTSDVAASNGLVRPDNVWKYGDAKIQEKYILHHPLGFVHAFIDSFYYQSKFYMDTFFSWLGFTYVQIPGLAELAGYLALGLSVLLVGKQKLVKYATSALAATVIIVTIIIFAVFFVAYTPPGSSIVQGVQGRYFLPITVLTIVAVAYMFPNLRINDKGITSAKVILIFLVAFCLIFSIVRYGLAITV